MQETHIHTLSPTVGALGPRLCPSSLPPCGCRQEPDRLHLVGPEAVKAGTVRSLDSTVKAFLHFSFRPHLPFPCPSHLLSVFSPPHKNCGTNMMVAAITLLIPLVFYLSPPPNVCLVYTDNIVSLFLCTLQYCIQLLAYI